ncbi:Hypothetical predicted protein [Paramuricea clavata]|uniref:Uncharacterized protein n=1 Tax=Paramuricea clavata TaxID=317549 RepID=A0A6S7G348_PARCT|nr:Hypothetical predicted protein [Paramuricea clavata]
MNLKLISGEVCEKESFDGNLEGAPKACGLETVESDPVLKDYQDCFSYKPGKLTSEVHQEVDPSVSPVIHPPRKIPVALLDPVKAKLHEMEEDGIIVREERHTPWVSSMVVVDKRKGDTPECGKVVKGLQHRQLVSKKYYDRNGRDLPPLDVGDKVRIRPNRDNKWRSAEVLPRSYVVRDESGSVYRRNRKQIISVPKDGDHNLQPEAMAAPESGLDLMPDPIPMDPPEQTTRRSQRG